MWEQKVPCMRSYCIQLCYLYLSHSFHSASSLQDKCIADQTSFLTQQLQLPWQLQPCYIGALCVEILLLQLGTICFWQKKQFSMCQFIKINSGAVKNRNNRLLWEQCGSGSFCSQLWICAAHAPTSSPLKFLLSKEAKDQSRWLAGRSSGCAAMWAP